MKIQIGRQVYSIANHQRATETTREMWDLQGSRVGWVMLFNYGAAGFGLVKMKGWQEHRQLFAQTDVIFLS